MAVITKAWQKGGLTATGGPVGVGNSPSPISVAKHVIDINKIMNGTNNIAAVSLGAADQVPVMQFPAGTILLGLQAVISIAIDSSTTRIDLGDGGSATRFVSNYTTPLTLGSVLTQALTTNPLYFYSTADQLLLKLTGTYTTASVGAIRFVIYTMDASADPISTTQS
jgi:hypothetical protein